LGRARPVLVQGSMKDARLFVIGHLMLIAVAILGSM
jgi:hypothetical protein